MMRTFIRLTLSILLVLGSAHAAFSQNGTIAPAPWFTGLDNNGRVINGGKLCTYAAGTSTPKATYSDVGLMTPNANPVILDPAGRATVFLSATSYKFVLRQPGTTTDCTTGTILRTADNISAVPVSATNLAVLGVAGQALTAGQVVYLSDGSGAKTAGQWFPADSSNAYSSVTPYLGITQNAIASGGIGAIATGGSVSGLSALTIGVSYFVSTTGTITATAPGHRRYVGQADTVTSIVLQANPAPAYTFQPVFLGCGIRATLTSGTPVTTADVTASTNVFLDPYASSGWGAGLCAFYDTTTSTWNTLQFTEITVALGTLTAGLPYDIFCFDNSGTMACDAPVAWTNTTTRATALTTQNGVPVKTGALTRRYIATFYTTSTTQTADSVAKRDLSNYYNRVRRPLRVTDATAGWNYSTATYQQANASATNQVEGVVGVADLTLDLFVSHNAGGNAGAVTVNTAIGEDSTTTADALFIGGGSVTCGGGGFCGAGSVSGRLAKMPAVGWHKWVWLEKAQASGTTSWGNPSGGAGPIGLSGWIEN